MGQLNRFTWATAAALITLGAIGSACGDDTPSDQTASASATAGVAETVESTPTPDAATIDATTEADSEVGSLSPQACEQLGPLTGIPDTSVAVPLLADFYVVQNFTGLFNDRYTASVVVVDLGASWDDFGGGIDTLIDLLESTQGVRTSESWDLTIDERAGHLLRASQTAGGITVDKWAVVVSDDAADQVLMVTAQVPVGAPPVLVETLRDALLCVTWTPGAVFGSDVVLFEIDPARGWEEQPPALGGRTYLAGENAFFIIAPSIVPVASADRIDVVLAVFASLGPGPIDERPQLVSGPTAITIDGLPGLAIDGTGVNEGVPIVLYQVVVFTPEGAYVRMVGATPTNRVDELLPQIRAMAESFRYQP
jgi:hypothetical protein